MSIHETRLENLGDGRLVGEWESTPLASSIRVEMGEPEGDCTRVVIRIVSPHFDIMQSWSTFDEEGQVAWLEIVGTWEWELFGAAVSEAYRSWCVYYGVPVQPCED